MTRRGMTLVEMLVATTATLILMAAVAQVFSVFGSSLSDSRSMVELDGRLRTVAARLRGDLAGATARPLPPLDPQAGEGYFEVIEGPRTDVDATAGTDLLFADTDDVLLFTTRNTATPFIGRAGGNGIAEATTAEVAWFLRETAGSSGLTTYSLYRRQLLVVGTPGFPPFQSGAIGDNTTTNTLADFYDRYDISVRPPIAAGTVTVTGSVTLTPNTLADLTRRECRFLHSGSTTFPYPFVEHQSAVPQDGLVFSSASARFGEDVILTNVLAFDVRVFDPAAPVGLSNATAVVPGDPGAGAAVASGAYVDLGNGIAANAALSSLGINPHFSGFGEPQSRLMGSIATRRTYDTWSTHYEANGLDEENGTSLPIDAGSDGLDNNANGEVDEFAEQETRAPYPFPLRGVEVRIRCWEPSSRQVRQVTVRHTFVPH